MRGTRLGSSWCKNELFEEDAQQPKWGRIIGRAVGVVGVCGRVGGFDGGGDEIAVGINDCVEEFVFEMEKEGLPEGRWLWLVHGG